MTVHTSTCMRTLINITNQAFCAINIYKLMNIEGSNTLNLALTGGHAGVNVTFYLYIVEFCFTNKNTDLQLSLLSSQWISMQKKNKKWCFLHEILSHCFYQNKFWLQQKALILSQDNICQPPLHKKKENNSEMNTINYSCMDPLTRKILAMCQ